MADGREDIMQRLMMLAAIDGVIRVGRNVIDPSDTKLPAVILLEGDEEANEDDPTHREPYARRRVTMTPHLMVLHGTTVADIGTDLNTLSRRLIKAVLTDATLAALTVNGRGVRYMATQSDLAFGRQMQGQMAVVFAITYWLEPNDL